MTEWCDDTWCDDWIKLDHVSDSVLHQDAVDSAKISAFSSCCWRRNWIKWALLFETKKVLIGDFQCFWQFLTCFNKRLSLTSLLCLFWLHPERPLTCHQLFSPLRICETSHHFLYPGRSQEVFTGSWRPLRTHKCWAFTSSFSSLFLYPQVAGGLNRISVQSFPIPLLTHSHTGVSALLSVSLWVIMQAWSCDSQQETIVTVKFLEKL